ncbi:MAG: GspE/PulE family protein [Victivallaceae bacterium]
MAWQISTGCDIKLQNVAHRLEAIIPDYSASLPAVEQREEYDFALAAKYNISEKELLDIYCNALSASSGEIDNATNYEKLTDLRAEYLEFNNICPVLLESDKIIVFTASPYNLIFYRNFLSFFYQHDIFFELIERNQLTRLLAQIYRFQAEPDSEKNIDENDLRQLAANAGVVKIVDNMFNAAIEQNASDIHIEPEEDFCCIRFRIDGVLSEYLTLPLHDYPALASRIKLLGNLNIAESRTPQDGRTQIKSSREEFDIRISTIPILCGESIVLRLLRKKAMKFDLKELGMPKNIMLKFNELIHIEHGIILVVGPTGSGKSTTLYSVMQQLNDRERKIITIEDPVEYQLPGLSQMQVNPQINLNFANGLRHIVRQDPDIILVGEIRDQETADIAINAALTGHLVLSTLHTNDAPGAITRLLDMGVEPFLIAASLNGVLSQRLVRTICPICSGKGKTDSGKCRNCSGSGYRGRQGVFELLPVDQVLREAISNGTDSEEFYKLALQQGMIPLETNAMELVRQGVTAESEILRICTLQGKEL